MTGNWTPEPLELQWAPACHGKSILAEHPTGAPHYLIPCFSFFYEEIKSFRVSCQYYLHQCKFIITPLTSFWVKSSH